MGHRAGDAPSNDQAHSEGLRGEDCGRRIGSTEQAIAWPGAIGAVSALTMAELPAAPHTIVDAAERARRQERLQRAEGVFDPLPFEGEEARSYGRTRAADLEAGRTARGTRAVDRLTAATACAAGAAVFTRNPDDFQHLRGLVAVVAI